MGGNIVGWKGGRAIKLIGLPIVSTSHHRNKNIFILSVVMCPDVIYNQIHGTITDLFFLGNLLDRKSLTYFTITVGMNDIVRCKRLWVLL